MATSPRIASSSSIWVTCRSVVQPLEDQGAGRRVGDLLGRQRARALEERADVAREPLIRGEPPLHGVGARPRGEHPAVEREVGHRADHRAELDQRAVDLERVRELPGPVGVAEPAPCDEVGGRRDRGGRVDLEHRQALHERHEVRRAGRLERLRPNGDPPRLLLRQLVHRGAGTAQVRGRRGSSRRISAATACSIGVPAARPASAPSKSSRSRFWLSLRVASSRRMGISSPTIARACVST